MIEDCWYKEVCNKEDCSNGCIRYIEMKYLIENSNLPKKRCNPDRLTLYPQECDYDAFVELQQIKDNIVQFVEDGQNLYIASHYTGNGKTTWSIKLMLKYFDEIWAGNGLKVRGIFVNVPTLLNKIKANISDKDPKVDELLANLTTADLVVWDDIGSDNLSQYDHAQLLSYIDQRVVDEKANIFTGNTLDTEMTKAVGERLKSRIWNNSKVIIFYGEDRRDNKYGSGTDNSQNN